MKPVRLAPKPPAQALWTVVYALALRESLLRFGHFKLGLLWAVVEPALYVAVHLLVLGKTTGILPSTSSLLAYAFLGVVPYLVLRSMVEKGASTLEAGQALMTYRQVTPFTLLLARTGLDAVSLTFVAVLSLVAISWTVALPWAHPGVAFLAYTGLLVLSFGLGSCVAVLAVFYPATRKFIGVFNRTLYFVSGVLVPLSALAPTWGAYFHWNPLLHAIELLRESVLGTSSLDPVSLEYLWLCASGFLFLGLALNQVFKRELEPA